MPSVITSLALPPGVQQTANDAPSEERGRQRAGRREAAWPLQTRSALRQLWHVSLERNQTQCDT